MRCLQQRAVFHIIAVTIERKKVIPDVERKYESNQKIKRTCAKKEHEKKDASLAVLNSPYLAWNYNDPETAVFGAAFHIFEYLFVRLAPIILIGAVVGIFLTWKKE